MTGFMRYYIIAGEASGDLHGSNLMKGLYSEDPHAVIRFWGGDLMDKVFKENRRPASPGTETAPGQKSMGQASSAITGKGQSWASGKCSPMRPDFSAT